MKQRILLIDDEAPIRDLVSLYLTDAGFAVDVEMDGRSGLHRALQSSYDLIILDILLPELDGWQVCQGIRTVSHVPILMLTARDDETDVVLGLELGADDYVKKPFTPRELVARARALLRRGRGLLEEAGTIEFPDFRMDHRARELVVRGNVVPCPAKEFELLWLLGSNPRRVFTRDELLEAVWGRQEFIEPRTVDVHIHRLRDKIEPEPERPRYLRTVWGVGYRFDDAAR